MHVIASPRRRGGRPTKLAVALAAAATLVISAVPAARADTPVGAADPAVVNTWNAIAMTTIAGPAPTGAGKANAEAFLWLGYVHAAVYNAVNGITRKSELYESSAKGPKGASPQAAAAAAAHGVLMEYFGTDDYPQSGTIAANLDAQLAASLAPIPDGVSEDQGVRYGEQAAHRIIELRKADGRFAPIVFAPPDPLAPGVWRPTPPAMAPFFAPWLGFMEPLMLDSASQFRPGPPPAMSSPLYVDEFEEVRDYGVNTGSLRDAAQTESALFFSDTGIGPLHAAIRDLAVRRGDDISERARLFGAVQMTMADALFAIWDAKYHYGWWRPITAIREANTDGNDLTTAVPGWTPLVTTPPYPDWPSGLCGVVGAASTALTLLYGSVDLSITSVAAGLPGPPLTRHYASAATLQQDVIDARVWSGIHFRTADEIGCAMGTQVASWALGRHFAPTG